MKDVIIIGLGPAGISASIYLKRSGLNPLVIGQDFGTLKDYPGKIENYYGFENPISGDTLIENGIKQAKKIKCRTSYRFSYFHKSNRWTF
jgi:thioredoxin reductase (NADPH)